MANGTARFFDDCTTNYFVVGGDTIRDLVDIIKRVPNFKETGEISYSVSHEESLDYSTSDTDDLIASEEKQWRRISGLEIAAESGKVSAQVTFGKPYQGVTATLQGDR